MARGVAPRLGMALLGISWTWDPSEDRARMPRSLRVCPLGQRIGAIGYRDTPRASPAALSVAQLGAHRRELVLESEPAVCAFPGPVAEAPGPARPKMPAGRGCGCRGAALAGGMEAA